MQVNNLVSTHTPAATAASSSSSSSAGSTPLGDPKLFISLLTAQLKAQDPLNPMSPQDMVNQLTQVSSLQQLISINQTLTNLSTITLPKTTQPTNPSSNTQ
jgi:flagellar basal-body rod modification protein FlgD